MEDELNFREYGIEISFSKHHEKKLLIISVNIAGHGDEIVLDQKETNLLINYLNNNGTE